MKSVYINIPYCVSKCAYCDFPSGPPTSAEEIEAYFVALHKEMMQRLSGVCASVYFGGGTPSGVAVDDIVRCLEILARKMDVPENTEITLEVNPATVDLRKLRQFRQAGINRISLGVQSTQDRNLELLGRCHSAGQAKEAYDFARRAGFQNISCDLIYGLPGQNPEEFRQDLADLLDWNPEHLSLYALSLEPGTILFRKVQDGHYPQVDEDQTADMMEWMGDYLESRGFIQYELSNFSKKGFQCRHNLGYWQDRPYFGVGSSAHSFDANIRSWNVRSPAEYIARMQSGDQARDGEEKLELRSRMAESLILRLRLNKGLQKQDYSGMEKLWENDFSPIFDRLVLEGLLVSEQDSLRLTRKGRMLSNGVFREIL